MSRFSLFFGLFLLGGLAIGWQPQPEDIRTVMLREVNALRAAGCRCGLQRMRPAPPLTWNDQLAQAASAHAEDLQQRNRMGHTGSDGSTVSERARRVGYRWSLVGENVAWNYPSPEAVVQGWKESPGHCRNLMNPGFREMGAAEAGAYTVQVLGRAY
jgi:uncharacterized protein YkwD